MGKRRKGPRGPKNERGKVEAKVLKKPVEEDPEDFMYDDVDKFHLQKDKILLDEEDESGQSEDEEEEEEVLGLDNASDEEQEDDQFEDNEEQVSEGEDDFDDALGKQDEKIPSSKAWGRKKKIFYDTDVKDDDIYGSDEEAERAAHEEEQEAIALQKRMNELLDDQDFNIVEEMDSENDEREDKRTEEDVKVVKDLSKMSKKEKIEILSAESPELPLIIDEYYEKLEEIQNTYNPVYNLMKEKGGLTAEGSSYIQTKYQLLLNYCVNMSFYLYLKSKQQDVKNHPVMERILQHQRLLKQLEPVDKRLKPEIDQLLKESASQGKVQKSTKETLKSQVDKEIVTAKPSPKPVAVKTRKSKKESIANPSMEVSAVTVDPLEYYNKMQRISELGKVSKMNKIRNLPLDDEDDDLEDEESKRGITYEMAKNKGLTRKRKKELRNPRVKHKTKFKKAIIKRKSQVREVMKELDRYGGERTGIKSNLSKSVKIR